MLMLMPSEFQVGDMVLIESEQAEGESWLHLLDVRQVYGIMKNGEECYLTKWNFYLDMEYQVKR